MIIEEIKALLLQNIEDETDTSILSKLLNYYENLKEDQETASSPYRLDESANNSMLAEPELSYGKAEEVCHTKYGESKPPCQYSLNELKERLIVAETEVVTGGGTTHNQFMKEVDSWR